MGALLQLANELSELTELPGVNKPDAWAGSCEAKRRKAAAVDQLVRGLDQNLGSETLAATLRAALLAGVAGAVEYTVVVAAAVQAGWIKGGQVSSVVTIKRAILSHRDGGKAALLDKRAGKRRLPQPWDIRAANLWANPASRGYADIAWQLRGEGYAVTDVQVNRYIKSLPAGISSPNSAARIGKHMFKLNRKHHVRRHTEDILTGEMYAGDGHTVDAYMAHPNTGGLFRPELTLFLDIKSRYVAGWWLSESETKESTLFALSSALMRNDHVPAWVYIDHGAGYRAKLMSDENTGWYAKFDIAVTAAIPGNSNGKGWIERFFRTVRDKHDKFFADGMMYCGDDMAPEINRRLSVEVKQGKRKLPSFNQYKDSLTAFFDQYHNEPMDVLKGRTPAQVWAELQPVAVGTSFDAVMRPSEERTVGHQEVRLHNRHYHHDSLADYDGQKVMVEYDLHDDALVWVRDLKGRLLCTAKLVHSIGVLPASRLEEQRDRREKGQVKRLQRHIDEVSARRMDPIEAADQFAAIEALRPATPTLPAPTAPADAFEIDLLTWRKDQ